MGRKHGLSVKIQLDLFDKMIKPIVLYGCGVWGYADLKQQIINYLSKLEDGITPIEITEFVPTVIKMNSVMNFTIF